MRFVSFLACLLPLAFLAPARACPPVSFGAGLSYGAPLGAPGCGQAPLSAPLGAGGCQQAPLGVPLGAGYLGAGYGYAGAGLPLGAGYGGYGGYGGYLGGARFGAGSNRFGAGGFRGGFRAPVGRVRLNVRFRVR